MATHPDGTPWAFALTSDNRLHAFELQGDSTWKPGPVHMPDFGNWTDLRVQYLRDRPATAWVFARDRDGTRLRALSPLIPALDDPEAPRWAEQTLPAPPTLSERWACGWEKPEQGLGGPTPVLRLYVVDATGKLTCHMFEDRTWEGSVAVADDVDAVIEVWSGVDENLGVLFYRQGTRSSSAPPRSLRIQCRPNA